MNVDNRFVHKETFPAQKYLMISFFSIIFNSLIALTACNVGKSVNHLRGHKNSEIQKKARGLVDTWKKRVNAEMTMLELTKLKDEKSTGAANPTDVSLSGKPGSSDLSQGVSKRSSAEALPRNLISQHSPSCKSLTGKSHSGQSSAASSCYSSLSIPRFSCFFLSLSLDLDRSTIRRRSIGARTPVIDRGGDHLTIDLA